MLIDTGRHQDSAEEWNTYLPLFDLSINRVITNLQSILSCHGVVIPAALKTLVLRTIRQLSVEQTVFKVFSPAQTSVKMRIQEVLRALAMLARTANVRSHASPVVPFRE